MCVTTGLLRCQACARVVPDYSVLAQHIKDKHGGSLSGAAGSSAAEQQPAAPQPPGLQRQPGRPDKAAAQVRGPAVAADKTCS